MLPAEADLRTVPGGRPEVALALRLPWYRSLPLSCVDGIEIAIDGAAVPEHDVTISVGDAEHSRLTSPRPQSTRGRSNSWPRSLTIWSQVGASRTVAAVRAPPFGPERIGASNPGWTPMVDMRSECSQHICNASIQRRSHLVQ